MAKLLTVSIACCLALGGSLAHSADAPDYKYAMKIAVVSPKGSLSEAVAKDKTKPSSVRFTPCNDDLKQDVLSFQLDYDAGKVSKSKEDGSLVSSVRDVYLFAYNPNALGALADDPNNAANPFQPPCLDHNGLPTPCDPKVWALVRPAFGIGNIAIVPLAEASDIVAEEHIYLSADENIGQGKISEQLLRSYIRFDDLQKGVWVLVGIIAPQESVDFTDTTTWSAWDAATFMLGAPWTTEGQETSQTCE